MLKHEELTNPDSCLNRARDDELVFVLLARDVSAPAAVRAWIAARIESGKNVASDAQIVEAEEWIARAIVQRIVQRNTGVDKANGGG